MQHLGTDLNKHYSHIRVVVKKSVCVGIQSSYAPVVLREEVGSVWFLFFLTLQTV